jgi:alpha-galactosidase
VLVLGSVVFAQLSCGREDVELAPVARSSKPADAPVPAPADSLAPEPVDSSPTDPPDAAPSGAADAAAPNPPDDCSAAVPEGLLGARPPMGWNGYNAFGCSSELDEAKVKAIATTLLDSGMQSAGYHYVNLDTCWQLERGPDGERVFDPALLPSGVAALSDWMHERGLSFGIYSHIQDCDGMAGGQGYETMDAARYAEWGVDYLKVTHCGVGMVPRNAVVDLAAALAGTDRPMVLSLATGSFEEWMRDTVQVWRTSGDVQPTWSSIVSEIDATVPLAAYARPGAFNDPDMLELGNGSLTVAEQRVQFSVWSILSAPLLAGNDLTTMTEETRAILTKSEVIALNQDPLGLQAALVHSDGDVDVLAKPLSACGARAVVLWNRSETSAEISLAWHDLWLEPEAAAVRDLWNDTMLQTGPDGFTVTVPGHDAVALRVDGSERPLPRGRVYLSDLGWTYATNGFGPIELDRTNGEDQPLDGAPIRLRGAAYDKGLGVHGPSLIRYRLGQACSRFQADVGIDDDEDGQGSVQFEVWADGEPLFRSGRVTGTSPTQTVDIDVRNRRELRLFVGIGGDTYSLDHALWAGALLECEP